MRFGTPLAAWLRGPLPKAVNQTLLDAQIIAPLSAPVVGGSAVQNRVGLATRL
jgi:hypothetical protein